MESIGSVATAQRAPVNLKNGGKVDLNGMENAEEYRPGGYHPVTPGDILGGRYCVTSKLGWGSFSTVWKCEDREEGCSGVAVKVVQSEQIATAMAKDEVTLLLKVKDCGRKEGHPGRQLVVQLLRNFEQWGPNGKHQCLVLEALGPSLLNCIQQNRTGLSMNKVKEVMSQVMQGLDFLHSSAGIIHTDVKLENILLVTAEQQDFSAEGSPLKVKIADLGGACWTNQRFSVEIGTRQYRAPEVLVGVREYGPGVDVWAAGCTAFELATGRFLFQPKACQKWSKDDDHLRLITQTVGPLPKEVIEEGTTARKFYSGEKLKKLNEGDIQTTSIVKQLVLRKTWLQFSDVQAFSRWLELLLNPDPRARTTAYQSAKHSFLEHGREKRKVQNIEEVVEEVERVSGTIEAAEDDSPNSPKGTNLLQKKFASLENKLDNVVKMLVDMKESAKKNEETIVQQGVEIEKLKEKRESADEKSLTSKRGRNGNDRKLKPDNDLGWFEIPQNSYETEYRGSEEEDEVTGETIGLKETGQVKTGGGGKCRPDFRHQHSTTKAKKVNWGIGTPKAGKKQFKLASPKLVPKIKDRAGGEKVNLKRRQILVEVAEGSEPKVPKSKNGGKLGVGFKVADLDGYKGGQVVCGAGKKHKAKACGKCEGCLRENCGLCMFCLDKPCFGGRNIRKQKCLERACTDPQTTRCEACL